MSSVVPFKKVTHCLFDMDGTILDSEVIYHKMITEICDKYNRTYTKELEFKLFGASNEEICATICKELKMPISAAEFQHQMIILQQRLMHMAPAQPGAQRLISHLHEYNVPMALATNAWESSVRIHAAARPQLFRYFHHMVSASDPEVEHPKPKPDIYHIAARRFPDAPKPEKVVMVPDSRLDRDCTRQATLVLATLLDFKPEMFGLPAFHTNGRTKN